MKFMRVCLLVCGLMLAFVGVTYASSFSVSADKYGKVEGNGIEFSFPENNKIIQIAFLTKDNERYIVVVLGAETTKIRFNDARKLNCR